MKLFKIGMLLLASATMAAVGLAVASPASADAHAPIHNGDRTKCLQPVDGSLDQGAAIVQQPCNGSAAQQWVFVPLSQTTYQVRNLASQRCLDARGGATNGTPIQQFTCSGISNEKWDLGTSFVVLRSLVSGTHSHCIDAPGGQTVDGLAMQLFACNDTAAQVWTADEFSGT